MYKIGDFINVTRVRAKCPDSDVKHIKAIVDLATDLREFGPASEWLFGNVVRYRTEEAGRVSRAALACIPNTESMLRRLDELEAEGKI